MAQTTSETSIVWSAATTKAVAAGASETSDEHVLDATVKRTQFVCRADNAAGSPASDATMTFYVIQEVAIGGSDQYATQESADVIAVLDVSTSGLDPQQTNARTINLHSNGEGIKVIAVNNGATDSITASCTIIEVLE